MRNLILTVLIIILLPSCSSKNINNDLLGNWKSTKSSNIVELQFCKDSLISNTLGRRTKFSWQNDETQIYYTQLTNLIPDLKTDFILEYRLNSEKDTLFLKIEKSKLTNEFVKTSPDD
ncbi:hypothetical protein [Algibacter sp. L3A6]|uniref:hypothetical protein n=1 Tax=Algibacter sp. L3A6 TaxID=2686366 RepID=UPI00131ABD3E|nr:hypothetical protein [Algibacter sp. L3A6]